MAGPYSELSVLPGARRVWWVGALLGMVTVALGVVALAWPHATIKVVGVAFGAYLLLAVRRYTADGVLDEVVEVPTAHCSGLPSA